MTSCAGATRTREAVAPQALLDAIMPLVQPAGAQARRAGRDRGSKHGLPPVLCDRTMVEQVLLNLARNAMQAMDQAQVTAPSLLIEVRRAGERRHGAGQELARVFGDRCRPGHSRTR